MEQMETHVRVSLIAEARAKLGTLSALREMGVVDALSGGQRAKLLANAAKLRRMVWADVRPICGKCWNPAVRREVDSIGERYAYCGRCWDVVKHVYCD